MASEAKNIAREIFVQKDGKQAGPYTLEMLNQMLAEGRLHGADYGWYEGLQDWIQITSLEGVVCRPSQSPPPFKPQVIADNQQMPHGRDDTDDEVIFLKYKKSLGVAAVEIEIELAGIEAAGPRMVELGTG